MGPLLSRYVDNEATAEERARVDGHVAACPDCRKELEIFATNERLVAEALMGALDWHGLAYQTVDAVRKAAVLEKEEEGNTCAKGTTDGTTGRVRGWLFSVRSVASVAAVMFFFVSACLAYSVFVLHDSLDTLCPHINQLAGTVDKLVAEQTDLLHALRYRDSESSTSAAAGTNRPGQDVRPGRTAPGSETGTAIDETSNHADVAETPEHTMEGEEPIRAFDVFALPDKVYAYWTFNPKSISPDAKYFLYRRQEDESDYDEIAGGSAGSRESYIDHNVKPMTPYEYQLKVDTGKGLTGVSKPVSVKTAPDLEVVFQGIAQGKGRTLIGWFKVIRRVEGRWVSALFTVTEGETVGGIKYAPEIRRDVDFSTGYVLAEVKHAERQKSLGLEKKKIVEDGVHKDAYEEKFLAETTPRATLDDFAGDAFSMWSGETRRGTRGLLKESR
jgi:hypothetical protein